MSRLLGERIKIAISPLRVALVRLAVGWGKPVVLERRNLPCVAAEHGPNWNGALATLGGLLEPPKRLSAPVTVILSNHFVRYIVLPWSAELVTQAEETNFASARFVQVFGENARQWSIRTCDAPAGMERVSAATDAALLDALTRTIDESKLKLASCEPAFMAQFNASRHHIGDNAWLVSAEHGRILLACIDQGRWRSVRTRPLNGPVIELRDLLEQERVLISASEGEHQVFVSAADDVVVDTQGLVTRPLGPRDAGRPENPNDGFYALAMAGWQ